MSIFEKLTKIIGCVVIALVLVSFPVLLGVACMSSWPVDLREVIICISGLLTILEAFGLVIIFLSIVGCCKYEGGD